LQDIVVGLFSKRLELIPIVFVWINAVGIFFGIFTLVSVFVTSVRITAILIILIVILVLVLLIVLVLVIVLTRKIRI